MTRMNLAVISSTVFVLIQCQMTLSQQLSYANAEIGQSLIRPHSTTLSPPNGTVIYLPRSTTPLPPHLTTTKKPGFFSNLRNIFVRGSTTTGPTTTTTTNRPSVVPTTRHTNHGPNQHTLRNGGAPTLNSNVQFLSHESSKTPTGIPQMPPSVLVTSTTKTITSTTQAPKKPPTEDFPPLAPPRHNRPSVLPTSAPIVNNQWTSTTARSTTAGTSTTTARPTSTTVSSAPTARRPSNPQPLSRTQSSSSIISVDSRNEQPKGATQRPELATDAEIEELTELLFKKSSPNLYPYLMVNLQGKTKSSLLTDEAPQPLLTLNETILNEIPTIEKMRALFNNYELDSAINEYVSPIEREEENEFINEILKTPVMKTAMKFLQDKGVVTADPKTHFDLLKIIWFNLYSRGQGKIGSSAFEHVFMNEIKNMSVTGLHNWIWFYHREGESGKMHVIDYKGYMKSILLGNKAQVLKFRFSFDNIDKPVNAMFVGTPPELDMALYTVCFEVNKSECRVSLDGHKFVIRTFPFKYRGKRLIGSAFPEI